MSESFEAMLTGGHPNSLGRTLEVVDCVLADRRQLHELYCCYDSDDEVVRLRTSNAIKRICKEKPDWLVPYIDKLINRTSLIDQASTQWTLATLFQLLQSSMNQSQRIKAIGVLKRNLESHDDWIVLNNTMQVLAEWDESDNELMTWLKPQLQRLHVDKRKSVSRRAGKLLSKYY